jgi:hypothetical protein
MFEKNPGKLTVRPKIKDGESLSGYLVRVALSMCVEPVDLMKTIVKEFNKHYKLRSDTINLGKIPFQLDMFPERIFKISEFSSFIGKTINEIEYMTFTKVFGKVSDDVLLSRNEYAAILSKMIHSKRKFCRRCLREGTGFKLIWQVKDIYFCNIHHTKLLSECPYCGQEQKYFSNALGVLRCHNCGKHLCDFDDEICSNETTLKAQKKCYGDWNYLIYSEDILTEKFNNFTLSKSLAIKLYYIIQNEKRVSKDESNKYLGKMKMLRMVNFIKKDAGKYNVNLYIILNILNAMNIRIEQFARTYVPDLYIQSLLRERPKLEAGVCLSSWCKCYGSNRNMLRLTGTKVFSATHLHSYICTGCCMPFGINRKSDKWEAVDNIVLRNIDKVREMLLAGYTKQRIAEAIGSGVFIVDKVIGYLLNHYLLPKRLHEKFAPKAIPSDIIEFFKKLLPMKGAMWKNAIDLFGWSAGEFYYYLEIPEVQIFLAFDVNKYREFQHKRNWKSELEIGLRYLLENDIDIDGGNVKKYIRITYDDIYRNKLGQIVNSAKQKQKEKRVMQHDKLTRVLVEGYIKDIPEDHSLTLDILYRDLEINQYWIRRNNPKLAKWISEQVRIFGRRRLEKDVENYKRDVQNIIESSHIHGKKLSIFSISKKMGKHNNFIFHRPQLKKFTSEAINKLY